jgi:hypothetical protein
MRKNIGLTNLHINAFQPLKSRDKSSMATTHLPPDFKEFLKLLKEHNVRYLLIGGYAVGYHGYPRATADMDIWVAIQPDNAQKIVAALQEFGFNLPQLSPDIFLKREQIIRMGVPPIRLEITTSISGVEFDPCYQERVIDNLDGIEVNLISLKYLKINKKASGRYKDLNDLENLP